jgi:polar amino acid transport system substrate-binding protein
MVGLEVELARRFGAYLGREPEWQSLTWTALISTLAAKKADVIISSMYITEERKQRIDFSDPYYTNGNFFFIHAKRGGSASDAAPQAHIESAWFERIKSSFYSNLVREERYLLIWNGLKVTVELSILSALLGTLLGAVLCAMRMSQRPAWSWPARLYIALLRGTPVLVLLMIIFYVVFASVNVEPVMIAVVAFAMNFGAYSAEIFRVGIESVDRGQTEGGVSMGFTPWATFVHIVLPQTVQRVLPVFKGEFISLVKMTSIVGYVAVEDLTKASDIIRSRTFDAFFPLVLVGVLYFLISWVLIQALEYLERRTDPMQRRVRKAM